MSDQDAPGPPSELHPFISAMILKGREANIPALSRLAQTLTRLSAGTPEQARALVAAVRPALGSGPAMRTRREIQVPTRAGWIRALLLVPEREVAGLCLYLHGGGWVVGTPEDYDALACTIADRSGCAVLLPDYRLAPEHPFPAALTDCEDVAIWAWRQRVELLGAALPMVAAGDSAAANLVISALARLPAEVKVAGQVLIYPVVNADFATLSYDRFGTGLPLSKADMNGSSGTMLSPDNGATRRSPHCLRLMPKQGPTPWSSWPSTMCCSIKATPTRAGLQWRAAWFALRRYPGVTHGFIRLHSLVDTADTAVAELSADIARFCHPRFTLANLPSHV